MNHLERDFEFEMYRKAVAQVSIVIEIVFIGAFVWDSKQNLKISMGISLGFVGMV